MMRRINILVCGLCGAELGVVRVEKVLCGVVYKGMYIRLRVGCCGGLVVRYLA